MLAKAFQDESCPPDCKRLILMLPGVEIAIDTGAGLGTMASYFSSGNWQPGDSCWYIYRQPIAILWMATSAFGEGLDIVLCSSCALGLQSFPSCIASAAALAQFS